MSHTSIFRLHAVRINRHGRSRACQPSQGFTLVELLVALVLGLVLIGGALNMVVSNRNTVRLTENVMRVQENARTAFEMMSRDIREAGQIPCGIPDTPNSVAQIGNVIRSPKTSSSIPWWADWKAGALRGFASGTAATGIVDFGTTNTKRVNGTAAVLTMQAGGGAQVIVSHDTAAQTITLQSDDGFGKADIVMACDLTSATIFQLEKDLDPAANILTYIPVDTIYNCSEDMGANTPANCATTTPKIFAANGLVAPLKTTFWYIGYNQQNRKSLYRTYLKNTSTATTVDPQEVLTGVKDLQIQYLTIDLTTVATPVIASNWVDAGSITDWTKASLNQVIGVKLTLTFETEDTVSSTNTTLERESVHIINLRSRETLL